MPFSQKSHKAKTLLNYQVLPRVAAEVSAPLAQTDKITMVSSGDGPVGASKLTEEVGTILVILFWSSVLGLDVLHY